MPNRALPKKAILVVNTHSRTGAESFDAATRTLRKAGVELVDTLAVDDPTKFDEAVRDAVKRAPMVILGGGDGSISSTVDRFVGKKAVLAVLPLGTANSFARTLGIPLELEAAVDVVANGRRKQIDLGCINGDHFANTAVIGLSPLIADTIPKGLKRVLGRVGYLVWAIRWAVKFAPFRLAITMNSSTRNFWATEVRIANGGHFGGIELIDEAEVDSGDLVVQAVVGKSKVSLAKSWLGALIGLTRNAGEVKEFRARQFRIETTPRLDVAIDGETSVKTPIEVSVARAAIDVAVPVEGS